MNSKHVHNRRRSSIFTVKARSLWARCRYRRVGEGTRLISAETHHQNIDFNIYEGMEVTGIPAVTLSRGSVVWQDGQLKTVRGAGKYIDRPCFPPYFDAVSKHRETQKTEPVDRS